MTDPSPTTEVSIWRLTARGDSAQRRDVLAVEEPLEIRVEGRSIAVTMRTPGHDRELVAGFLLSEGVIQSARDVFEISTCPSATDGNVVDVILTEPERVDFAKLTRHVFTSSSCGMCGKASLEAALQSFPALEPATEAVISVADLLALPDRLRENQAAFSTTGGIHASALFDFTGRLLMVREDVGRHNALDKILGACLLENKFPMEETILLLSGRVSFELMQKALAARIPIVAAVGAPSSLAVSFAQVSGQTLLGFIRDARCNLYAAGVRIRGTDGLPFLGCGLG